MEETQTCKTCGLLARRDRGEAPLWDSIHRTPFWDVVHCNDTSLPGWTVVVARRHVASIAGLTRGEAVELGLLLRNVSAALREITHCEKTYVLQFAEGEGHHHVHFHVIPRMADLPEESRSVRIVKYLGVPAAERVSEESMNAFARDLRRLLEDE
jgi:diadenosine tetraphosphate (Ap4A) HIT family hydrolase